MKTKALLPSVGMIGLGALLTFAFAPFHLGWLALIIPAIVLGICLRTSRKSALWLGWLFGIGFFGGSVSWVYISIHTYGGTNIFLAGLLTLLFVMVLALFTAFIGFMTRCLLPDSSVSFGHIMGFYPLIWLSSEALRSSVGTGFPWVILGYSQLDTPLRGYIPIIGAYGVSLLTVICAVLIYWFCLTRSAILTSKLPLLLTLGMIMAGGQLLTQKSWTRPIGEPITISLIQGNVTQDLKWDAAHFAAILQSYKTLTQTELGRNLIIWPEGSVPALTSYVPDYLAAMEETLQNHGSVLLLGTFMQDSSDNIYNSILELGNAPNVSYSKRHRVPFGEYLPFEKILRGLINFFDIPMSTIAAGSATQKLIPIGSLQLSASICYEVAFPTLLWRDAANSNLLVNISDDSWFDGSIAAEQQLQISQIRSLETGRPMLLSNNNGVTAVIDAKGQVISQLPIDKTAVLRATVHGYEGKTPIIRFYNLWKN